MKKEKLTQENFKPFGTVLSVGKEIPDANNEQFKFSANVLVYEMPGEITVGVLEGKKRDIILKCMERHLDTPEILFEIYGESILFVGKSDDKTSEITDIKAFELKQGESVLMNPGTWHWVPFPTSSEKSITQIIFKNNTSDNDCEIVDLPSFITID